MLPWLGLSHFSSINICFDFDILESFLVCLPNLVFLGVFSPLEREHVPFLVQPDFGVPATFRQYPFQIPTPFMIEWVWM